MGFEELSHRKHTWVVQCRNTSNKCTPSPMDVLCDTTVLIYIKEKLDVFVAKIEESERPKVTGNSTQHTWPVQPVLCYWATTTGQTSTLTILYIYCTGVLKCPSLTPGSHSVYAVRTLRLTGKFIYRGNFWPFHFPLFSPQIHLISLYSNMRHEF